MNIIETNRLILRTWWLKDAEKYLSINQDPQVIEFLKGSMSKTEVENFIWLMNLNQAKYGYTLWATELKETGDLIGFIGLNYTDFPAHFTPNVEVGWRLDSKFWNKGYATEGALAAIEYGFNKIGLKEIVSFTSPLNLRSIKVMERIGMKRDLEADFAHPKLDANHRLSQHILYRIKNNQPNLT